MEFEKAMVALRHLSIPILLACLLGCLGRENTPKAGNPTEKTKVGEAKPTLLGSDSVSGLAAFLDTLQARATRGDTVGLVKIMAGDSTYKHHVYPLSSIFDPAREEVFRFTLTMHKANNAKGLRRLLTAMRASPGKVEFALPALDSIAIPGGMIYRTRATDTLRIFSEAIRRGSWIQVVAYSGARARVSADTGSGASTSGNESRL